MFNVNQTDNDEEEYVDAIAEWFREAPKPTITIITFENFKRMLHSFCHIRKAFEEAGYRSRAIRCFIWAVYPLRQRISQS